MNLIKIKFCVPLLIILFFSTSLTSPLHENIKFRKLSLDEGAALNLTYCMMQDHKGYLWFGTMYGLVKYDGKSYKIYKNNPLDSNSISFDDILSLYEDSHDNIWIGTWGGGLNKFNPATEQFTRFLNDSKEPNKISDNIVWTICEDDDGNLWFGTETGGLNKFISGKNLFVKYVHLDENTESISSNFIRHIFKDSRGILWIAGSKGLSKYNKNSDNFTNYSVDLEKNDLSPEVNSIFEYRDKKLLLGTTKGIYSFDIYSGIFTKMGYLNKSFIHTICKGKEDNVWIGTNKGLFNINLNSGETRQYNNQPGNVLSLSGDNILNLMTDRSGILWVNAYGSGINKLSNNQSRFLSYSNSPGDNNSLSNNSVTSFCSDGNNNLWIGTRNGLNKFDKNEGKFTRFYNDVKPKNKILSLALENHFLWVGTLKGLTIFDTKSGQYKPLPALLKNNISINQFGITALLAAPDGRLCIGTYSSGLYIYDQKRNSLLAYNSTDFPEGNNRMNYILCLYEDEIDPDILWIGTYGGLIRMNRSNNSFKVFRHILSDSGSLSNDYVFSICRDSYRNLWVGTANGLNEFDSDNSKFIHFFEKDGLSNSVVNSIIKENNGRLWISTNFGISEYDISKNAFNNYNMDDGLQNNLFLNGSSFKDDRGRLYFGGTKGIDVIQPELFRNESFSPGVYITSVQELNEKNKEIPVSADNKIELNYNENFIKISYISLDYNNPLKNLYKYKLEGVDDAWINAGNKNQAEYTNLQPGSYVFRVKGSNSDGVFNPDEATLNFTVLPPFWKTTWFNFLIVSAVLAFGYLLYRLKVRQKINRALEIEKIREVESEKLRKKTAIDFHDELGHHLTRISLLVEMIKRKIGNTSGDVTSLLNKISSNSFELYEGTRDFIWAIDPHHDSLYELIIRLKDFGDELFEDSDILFEVDGLEESLKLKTLTMDWKRHLALIFKEGMNNSLKHSRSKKISISSRVNDNNIEMILSDDGDGFLPELAGNGNGLRNMKKRAEKLLGKLEITSVPGKGTKVYFKGTIPEDILVYN